MATIKDGDAICALVRSMVQKVKTIIKKKKQAERLLEIKNSFLSYKKNVNIENSIEKEMQHK
jgi:hypothetical protein